MSASNSTVFNKKLPIAGDEPTVGRQVTHGVAKARHRTPRTCREAMNASGS
jgi:hypothetical protein